MVVQRENTVAHRRKRKGKDMASTLTTNMKASAFDKTPGYFLPESMFEQLFSVDSIKDCMGIAEEDDLVKFVSKEALRVFAIMALIANNKGRLKQAMSWFRENNFCDRDLPIQKWDFGEEDSEEYDTHQFESMEEGAVGYQDEPFWNAASISRFEKTQFEFLAPIFSTEKFNHDLWDRRIPFVAKDVTYAEGSFGMISKYHIHPDHIQGYHTMKSPPTYAVAVKEIKVDNEQDRRKVARSWASEVKAMARMNSLDHNGHIVHFITAFRRGTRDHPEHYLITEWADGGNLKDLWKELPKPDLATSIIQEMITQLLGLAQALSAAHYLTDGGVYSGASYRHGDLKPANILWFKEEGTIGTLKICDWGCAKNKDVVTAMRHSKTSSEYGTRRYEPPEVETGMSSMLPGSQERRISRLYDIWSMGCIILECIVWLLYGWNGLEKFNQSVKGSMNESSPFWQLNNPGSEIPARVHNVVSFWMDYMAKDPACEVGRTALGDLLEIVQGGLLVVKIPRRGGTFALDHSMQPSAKYFAIQSDNKVNSATSNGTTSGVASETESTPAKAPPNFAFPVPEIRVTDSGLSKDDVKPQFNISGPERLRADQLRDRIDYIATADEEDGYWHTKPQLPIPVVPEELYSDKYDPTLLPLPVKDQVDYGHPKLDPYQWEFDTDNRFAAELFTVFKENGHQYPVPKTSPSCKLCTQCEKFRDGLWDIMFQLTYGLPELETRAKNKECDLCELLWRTCNQNWTSGFQKARFERFGSSIQINSGHVPVLSITRDFECNDREAADLQIGFGELPEVGSKTHLEIIRKWLIDCDENHCTTTCKPATLDGPARLPTRLIDVGIDGDTQVHLKETHSKDFEVQDTGGWVALSHQWGPHREKHFSTTSSNLNTYITGIELDKLPATFRDAVFVTRALRRRYLWIDSICIIQAGGLADFEQEGKRMEDVYSGAYCVIAATRATDHHSGFLRPRVKANHVTLQRGTENNSTFNISQGIDNFKEQILDGGLSSRGWVLQEHALARRTIFFADYQTFWECGSGVRCETMTKLRNESAQLLGDPNFPQILDSAPQGERIIRYQELYENYSRLSLSQPSDRPRAMSGLEQRLLQRMGVKGGFGIFDAGSTMGLLRRSLLWHRGSDTPSLSRISRTTVPSWSWQAYTYRKHPDKNEYAGGINYFKLTFNGYEWMDFESPWSRSENGEAPTTLSANIQAFAHNAARSGEDHIVYDTPEYKDQHSMKKCVVIGVQKGAMSQDNKRHWILIVAPTNRFDGNQKRVYERIGAGYLPGRCFSGDSELANIQ